MLYTLPGNPQGAVGLIGSCLRWQRKPTDNSSSCFANLQHYNNYLARHSASKYVYKQLVDLYRALRYETSNALFTLVIQ